MKMEYTLKIIADYNDADYVSSEHIISEETLKEIRKIIKVIRECPSRQNWDKTWRGNIHKTYKGKLTEEDIEWFGDFVPYAEHGVHTIVEVKIAPKVEWESLL